MKLTNPFGETAISVLTPKGAEYQSSKRVPKKTDPIAMPENVHAVEEMQDGVFGAVKVEIGGKYFIRKDDTHNDVSQLIAESAAFKLAEAMGYHFVPATYFAMDKHGHFYSLQRFVSNAETWNRANRTRRIADVIDRNKLTDIWLFDWLIQNHDRHGNNFLITHDNQPVAIDHGNAFRYQDWFPGVAYSVYANRERTLNEFAYRLAGANTEWLQANLPAQDYAMFREYASRIIVNAFKTFAQFKQEN